MDSGKIDCRAAGWWREIKLIYQFLFIVAEKV
jgi:hypothetical protein